MKYKLLIISAVYYIIAGLTDILGTYSAVRNSGFAWIPINIDERHFGYFWLVCGLAVLILNVIPAIRQNREPTSFVLLILPSALYALIFIISLFFDNNTNATRLVEWYTYLTVILIYLAGWPDPVELGDLHNDV